MLSVFLRFRLEYSVSEIGFISFSRQTRPVSAVGTDAQNQYTIFLTHVAYLRKYTSPDVNGFTYFQPLQNTKR
jgi:hypothetical protein